jgi:hypothetical protein
MSVFSVIMDQRPKDLVFEGACYKLNENTARNWVYRCQFYKSVKCCAKLFLNKTTNIMETWGSHVCNLGDQFHQQSANNHDNIITNE